MNQADVLTLAKNHPDTVKALVLSLNDAVQADASLVPDIVTAVEAHSVKGYGLFALKHLGFFNKVLGIVEGNQALRDQVSTVISGS